MDDELDRLRNHADRLAIALLAAQVRELVTIVGKLNALTGAATEQFTADHVQIKEDLFDVLATLTRVQDSFSPPAPPEEV